MKRNLRGCSVPFLKILRLAEESGISLVEVLVTALVIGTAVIGLSLMFGTGSVWVANTGDDRVASGLAQEEIERRHADGFVAESGQVGAPVTEPAVYPAGNVNAGVRAFTRVTCVQYVDDAGSNTPAYTEGCPAGALTNTLRITVSVTPNSQLQQASPVILQAWLVP